MRFGRLSALEVELEAYDHDELEMLPVYAVLAVEEARKRVPDHLKDSNPYSQTVLWTYYARTHHDPEGDTCNYCSQFDGQTFLGSDLRRMFPDHHWEGDDIYPDVHKTLWGREGTCACLLIREPSDTVDLDKIELWTGTISTDWKELPKEPTKDEVFSVAPDTQALIDSAQARIERIKQLLNREE